MEGIILNTCVLYASIYVRCDFQSAGKYLFDLMHVQVKALLLFCIVAL